MGQWHSHSVLIPGGGGGTRPENWWGCAAGRWKLDPKRSRKKLNLGPKRSIFVKIGSFCTPKDSFAVGGWEKIPQKDRARSCQSEKRGSKPRHICITHHIGSTPPPPPPPPRYWCIYSLMSRPTAPLCYCLQLGWESMANNHTIYISTEWLYNLGGNPWQTITQYTSVPSDFGQWAPMRDEDGTGSSGPVSLCIGNLLLRNVKCNFQQPESGCGLQVIRLWHRVLTQTSWLNETCLVQRWFLETPICTQDNVHASVHGYRVSCYLLKETSLYMRLAERATHGICPLE